MQIKNKIANFFNKGHERSIKVKKNIALSLFYKGFSILINLMLVPLTLNYLDKEQYGIWITISSIVMWFSFFDIGLGNGLRNKLTESLAKKDYVLSQKYISTTYFLVSAIFIFIAILFLFLNPYINWMKILNSNTIANEQLLIITNWIFIPFFLKFIFMLIGNILYADQRPSLNNIFNPLTNIISIISITILIRTTTSSLLYVSISLSLSQLIIPVLFNIYLFRKTYKNIRPKISRIDLSLVKELFSLGTKFFIIQISTVILFSATNIIIAQIDSQQIVADYNITHKYFFTLTMLFSIVMTPFWSAITEAQANNDFKWIRISLKKLNKISFLFVCFAVILFVFYKVIFYLWLGDDYNINGRIVLLVFLININQIIKQPFNTLINGTGKIQLHFIHSIFVIILFIPLAIIFGDHLKFGVQGVLIISLFLNMIGTFLWIIQSNKILNQSAFGIWNK